uniref:Uncharacterized protein n=1 Tax=Anopheles merus TaxID=30066 RepID=A0A182US37_ANOME
MKRLGGLMGREAQLISNTFIISSESTAFDCCTVSTRVELAVGRKRMTDGIWGRTVSFELAVPATADELGSHAPTNTVSFARRYSVPGTASIHLITSSGCSDSYSTS